MLALRQMSAARPAFEAQSPVAAAQSDLDRAEVLRDAGLTTEAEGILERVARTFGAHGMRQARAEAELSLSRSLVVARSGGCGEGRPRSRGGASARSEATPGRFGRTARSACAVESSRVWAAGRSRRPRPPDAPAGRGGVDRRCAGTPASCASEAAASGWRRSCGSPRPDDVRAPAAGSRGRPRSTCSSSLGRCAHDMRIARGTHAEVRRQCAAAGSMSCVRRQDAFGSLDLQTSVAMHATPLMMTGLAAAVDSGRPDIVFEWSERARHLSQQRRPAETAARSAARRRSRRTPHAARPDQGRGLAHPAAGRRLARPRAGAPVERHRAPWARNARDARPACGVRSTVRPRVLAVRVSERSPDHLCGRHGGARPRASTWRTGAQVERLLAGLRADLDVAASVRAGRMADDRARSLDDRLAALSPPLLDGPLAVAATRRLVLTAPGVLNGIPWAMLPGMRRAHVHARRLGDALAQLSRRGCASRPRRWDSPWDRGVARGAEEIARAASAWEDPRIIDGETTADSLTDLASQVDVLHVAAHGRHAVDNPLFSGLRARRRHPVRLRHRPDARRARTPSSSRPARSDARPCAGARRRSG